MHSKLSEIIAQYFPKELDADKLQEFLVATSSYIEEREANANQLSHLLSESNKQLEILKQQIDEQKQQSFETEKKLNETLVKQTTLLDTSPEAIVSFFPDGRINYINRSACELLGITDKKAKTLQQKENLELFLQTLVHPEALITELKKLESNSSLILRGYLTMLNDRFLEYNSLPEVLEGKYIGRVWCFRDISDIRKNQLLLQKQAHFDPLTKLPNRNLLLDTIKKAISRKKSDDQKVIILFIDLDDFKKINDTAGHEQGDKCLVEVCSRIKKELRQHDILGRLGGDEFLLILDNISAQSQLLNIIDRIISAFKKPFKISSYTYTLGASIGISVYPEDGRTPDELIRKADMAMYKAKQRGKSSYFFYDHSLEKQALHRISIENQLRGAIKNQELSLYYQPKINLKTGKIQGIEALIRWRQANGKIIYPDSFIRIAESSGLIRNITKWVLETACRNLVSWQNTALKNIPLSVNISAIDFADNFFLEDFFNIISTIKAPHQLIELEITESVFFDDIRRVIAAIAKLKANHIKLAIDDFGTGYSSFNYLQDLDVDYLKIDRSFVQGVNKNPRSLSIIKTIIDIGINLGLEVIAEGIETEEELAHLNTAGCHHGQGYLFSKPLIESDLLKYAQTK